MSFWQGRRVFVTGHTGFKGGWLCLYLHQLGAEVCGYALAPGTSPDLFTSAQIASTLDSVEGDICDLPRLTSAMSAHRPEVIFHLAAQPLVRASYKAPLETYRVNVMGSLSVLDAARNCDSVRAIVMITTDKCYQNKEWIWGYREVDRLGGHDPYSSSKACAELAVASWRDSFFPSASYAQHGVEIATARAGNVIGGGDWSEDRLVPDVIRSLLEGRKLLLRNPGATRPWQHVLEPLRGYILLAEHLISKGAEAASCFNFGPEYHDTMPVSWVVRRIAECWGSHPEWDLEETPQPHEANSLRLDWSKAEALLNWSPRLSLQDAVEHTTRWYRSWSKNEEMLQHTLGEIEQYRRRAGSLQEGVA